MEILPKLPAGLALALLVALTAPAYAADMIADGTFEKGEDGFWAAGGVALSRERGKLCADIEAGGESWDRLLGVNDLQFAVGTSYRLRMTTEGNEERISRC